VILFFAPDDTYAIYRNVANMKSLNDVHDMEGAIDIEELSKCHSLWCNGLKVSGQKSASSSFENYSLA